MRVLIFTLLALAVNATNYGYSNYGYSGYPSYSYGSYPTQYYSGGHGGYGGYGSSLYGATYGSGLGYGSGYGYGGGLASYTTDYKPAVYQTARQSYRQPLGTRAVYESGYSSGEAPGKIKFVLGGTGYQTGTQVLSDSSRPVVPRPAGVFTHGGSSIRRSGAVGSAAGVAPGRISFTQDFSRVSGQSGLHRSRGAAGVSAFAPQTAITEEHSGVLAGHGGSLHRAGVHGISGGVSQIHFQETADVSGADFTGAGVGGISAQEIAPKPFSGSHGFSGVHKSGTHTLGSAGPQISFTRDTSRVTGHSGIIGSKPQIHSFDKVSAPLGAAAIPKAPARPFHDSGSIHRGGAHVNAGPAKIVFTQDFSKVTGHSAGKAELHGFSKVLAPATSPVFPGIPSRSVGTTGTIHKSEAHGVTADHPRITFTQDFSKVSGQSQQIGTKPDTHSFDKTSFPVVGTVKQHESAHDVGSQHKTETHGISDAGEHGEIDFTEDTAGVSGIHTTGAKPAAVSSGRLSSSGVSSLPRPSSGYVHPTSAVHKSGVRGLSPAGGPQISFVQGQSALRQPDVRTPSFDKIPAPVVATRPSSGSRLTGARPNIPSQAFSGAAGPSRITFTQDFSRVVGHHTSAHGGLTAPAFPGVIASQGYQAARRNTAKFTSPVEAKPIQRPQQPSFTTVYDQSSAHGIFPVRSDAFAAGDKSIFAAGFADGHITDYRHANFADQEGVKLSNLVVIPGAGVAHDKSSVFKHSTVGAVAGGKHHSAVGARDHSQLVVPSYGVPFTGEPVDKTTVFVAVPAEGYGHDKSSVLLHSTEVAPTGSFVSTGEVDSALSKQGQAQGYNAISTPLKSHFSSSYPGYSQISGESPRYEFSHDRSLLYTYNSPSLISPFSYSNTAGNKYYGQGSRKTVA